MAYTEFDYNIMLAQFKQNGNSAYDDFKKNAMKGSDFLYGVRISKLRETAERINERDWKGFLSVAKDDSYEEILIQGLVIAGAKCSIHEKLAYSEKYLSKVDNWAICDTFCYALKDARKNLNETWNFLMRFIDSRKTYERRFVLSMLSDYFLVNEYIEDVIRIIINIDKREEEVMTAAAAALSEAYVKYRDLVYGILKDQILDAYTHNNTIKKCMDLYRISEEDKKELKSLIIKPEEI